MIIEGGGSVCFWAGFAYNGKLQIIKADKRLDARGYQKILDKCLIGHGEHITENGASSYTFQQDNASIHKAKTTMEYFTKFENIRLLDWPSKSPDLNPIENLWGILARMVYSNGVEYDNMSDLEEAVYRCWDEIEIETLRSLIDSMPTRIGKVLINQGKIVSY